MASVPIIVLPTSPAPLVAAHRTCHVHAAVVLLDFEVAFGTSPHILQFHPFVELIQMLDLTLTRGVLARLAFPTEFVLAVEAG